MKGKKERKKEEGKGNFLNAQLLCSDGRWKIVATYISAHQVVKKWATPWWKRLEEIKFHQLTSFAICHMPYRSTELRLGTLFAGTFEKLFFPIEARGQDGSLRQQSRAQAFH